MKAYIIAFVVSLVVACLLNEIQATPPPLPVGTSGVEMRPLAVMHEDGYIGEANFADTSRPAGAIKQVRDGIGGRDGITFPLNGNN